MKEFIEKSFKTMMHFNLSDENGEACFQWAQSITYSVGSTLTIDSAHKI
jgi:hypothetical protein